MLDNHTPIEIRSMTTQKLLKTALMGALTLGVASIMLTAANAAHKNDCKAPGHSCAGLIGTKPVQSVH